MLDEAALTRGLRSGDMRAFEVLYATHYESVWGLCLAFVRDRTVADDLAQDVFAWIWQHRATINVSSGWRAYLLRAGRNRAFNYLRHSRVVQSRAKSWPDMRQAAGVGAGPADTAERALVGDVSEALRRVIEALPERQRQVYTLRVQQSCTTAETASLMGITTKGVENALGRAVKTLREALKRYR